MAACGDEENDLMITVVGYPVAMGNGLQKSDVANMLQQQMKIQVLQRLFYIHRNE